MRAFFWSEGEMVNLGALPHLEDTSPYGINNTGAVVGACHGDLPGPGVAFVWDDGPLLDLNDLVKPMAGIDELIIGFDINNAGQIVAQAIDNELNKVAVILTPIEKPLTDLNDDCRTDVLDLLILLSEWGKNESDADFTGDGTVDVLDLLTLLGEWG